MHLQHRDFQQWDKWILLLRVAMILATSGWGQVKYFSSLSCWPGIWILWTFDCNCSCHPMKRNNTCTSIYQQHVQNIDCSTHRIYLYIIWYIYLYIYHENQLNVGKYIIHWMVNAVLDLPFFLLQLLLWQFFRMTPGRFCEGFGGSILLMLQKCQGQPPGMYETL